jgi:heme oxygenase (biliverdin-IX-beta and delta-forming)
MTENLVLVDVLLKERTKLEHASLEKLLLARIERIKHPEDYTTLLKQLYGYYAAMEFLLAKYFVNSILHDFGSRRKASCLIDDINTYQESDQIALCSDLPAIHSFHGALGAMYVLEGSTLGGPSVAKLISTRLNSTRGFSFFYCYGDNLRTKWASFKEYLREASSKGKDDEIISAAQETFITFKKWLSSHD